MNPSFPISISGLQNTTTFPSYTELKEGLSQFSFYEPTEEDLHPTEKHWCFPGQITQNVSLGRPVFEVKDRDGQKIMLAFYLDNEDYGKLKFDARRLSVGQTIVVLYAEKHMFMDGSIGIRVEDWEWLKVRVNKSRFTKLIKHITYIGHPLRLGNSSEDE